MPKIIFRKITMMVVLCLTGCVCRDGGFTYYCTVKVLDQEEQPVPNIRVLVVDNADSTPADFVNTPSRIALTNVQGLATPFVATGLTWGGCPGPTEAPIPENPGILFLWVEHPQHGWQCDQLEIQEQQITGRRPAELWIDLGTITLTE